MGFLKYLNPFNVLKSAKNKIEERPKDEYGRRRNISGTQKKFIKPIQKDLKGINKTGLEELLRMLNMQQGEDLQPEDITGDYETFSKPLMEQWETQILPGILERFAGGGNKNSSGLQQTLGQAGRGVQNDLSNLYAQLNQDNKWKTLGYNQQNKWNTVNSKQNALGSLLNYNNFAANPGFQSNTFQQGQPNWLQQALPYAGKAATNYFTGGAF